MAVAATDKTVKGAIGVVAAVLLMALGFVVVRIVITLLNPEAVWKIPMAAQPATVAVTSQGAQSFSFSTDPFNRNTAEVVEQVTDFGEDAPETTLNLKLTGRTAGTNGTAILRTPDNKEGNYRLGDEIVPGVTLQAVNRAFIVLDVDGELQRLTFEKGEETGLMPKAKEASTVPTQVTVKAPAGAAQANALQQASLSGNVSALFQNLSLRRVMKDGQLTGYSVKANRPGVDLKPFGFAKGDIVTAIGGTDITRGRPDFLTLFEQASQSGGTEITVLRNGQSQTIRLGTP